YGGWKDHPPPVAAEDPIFAASAGSQQLLIELVPEDRQDRDRPLPGLGLRLYLSLYLVPALADMDQVGAQVDVHAAKCLQLAAAKTRVEGGRPDRPVLARQCRE